MILTSFMKESKNTENQVRSHMIKTTSPSYLKTYIYMIACNSRLQLFDKQARYTSSGLPSIRNFELPEEYDNAGIHLYINTSTRSKPDYAGLGLVLLVCSSIQKRKEKKKKTCFYQDGVDL